MARDDDDDDGDHHQQDENPIRAVAARLPEHEGRLAHSREERSFRMVPESEHQTYCGIRYLFALVVVVVVAKLEEVKVRPDAIITRLIIGACWPPASHQIDFHDTSRHHNKRNAETRRTR